MRRWKELVIYGVLVAFLWAQAAWAVLPPGPTAVTIIKRTVFGDMFVVFADVQLPASYNSMLLTGADFGLTGELTALQFTSVTTNGYALHFDATTGFVTAFGAGGGGLSASFVGDPATPAGVISKPTFTVKTGTILANGTMGLDANASSANVVGGTGITADRTLTTTSPVGVSSFTGTPATPTGTIVVSGGGGTLGPVTGGTNLSAEHVVVIAYGH